MQSKAIFYSTVSLLLLSTPAFASRDGDVSDAEAYGDAFSMLRDMKKEENEKKEKEEKEKRETEKEKQGKK
jgi:hypothetical protein